MDSEKSSFGTTMLVGPASVGATATPYPVYMSGNGGGNEGWGSDWGWIILLLLLANGRGFGGYGGIGGGIGDDFPWLMNGQQNILSGVNANTDAAVNQLATQTAFGNLQNAITTGFGDVQNSLCGGFAGVNASISGAQNAIAQQLYSNQIADMQNSFAMQSQFANCCCEQRLGLANIGADIARENCADRAAISDGIRDVITNQTAGFQRVLDQLCSDKIDAKNEKIADLERQLTMANLAASQTAQTSRILADNAAQTVALEQYLNPVPVPAYVVQNPNCCQQNTCGCGCGSF